MTQSAILDPWKRSASVVDDSVLEGHELHGMTVIAVADGFSWQGMTVDWDAMTIIVDMPALRAAKAEEVNARRLEAEAGGCVTPFGKVDSDERSRGLISGAVLMALIAKGAGQPFAESWTMQDNSQVDLNADMMIGLGATVGIFISAVHARGVELKALVDAAADAAALDAIDLNTGWPT